MDSQDLVMSESKAKELICPEPRMRDQFVDNKCHPSDCMFWRHWYTERDIRKGHCRRLLVLCSVSKGESDWYPCAYYTDGYP